ncbi:hypothetical protein A2U01_0079636, partial [Trifolium medium]|nr:hypothetical protein [Trifolium medium]
DCAARRVMLRGAQSDATRRASFEQLCLFVPVTGAARSVSLRGAQICLLVSV